MRYVVALLLPVSLYVFSGCALDGSAGVFNRTGNRQQQQQADRQDSLRMDHEIQVERPSAPRLEPELDDGVPAAQVADVCQPLLLSSTRDGVKAEIPAGTKLTIRSASKNDATESTNSAIREETSEKKEKKLGLPWGVYAACMALIAGGVFVCFRFSIAWGVPLVLGGVLVYAVFTTINSNPEIVAYCLLGVCVLAVGIYILHAQSVEGVKSDAEVKADTISTIKRVVNNLSDAAKNEFKLATKAIVGDSSNPVRQQHDEQINNA